MTSFASELGTPSVTDVRTDKLQSVATYVLIYLLIYLLLFYYLSALEVLRRCAI